MARRSKQTDEQHEDAGGVAVIDPPADEAPATEAAADSVPADEYRLLLQQRDTLKRLTEHVDEAQAEYDDADAVRKEKKAALEQAQQALIRFARRVTNPEPMPLFDGANGTAPAEHPAGDEGWRDVPLAEALEGVTEKLLAKLQDGANLRTVGELADWTGADGGRHKLVDLPGIGEAAATKIEEALDKFWERRRQQLATEAIEDRHDDVGATAEEDEAAE